jgi:hypothetical protein
VGGFVSMCFVVIFINRSRHSRTVVVNFDPWLFQVQVQDPALKLVVERLVTVDPQSGLDSVHLVFEESGPDVE